MSAENGNPAKPPQPLPHASRMCEFEMPGGPYQVVIVTDPESGKKWRMRISVTDIVKAGEDQNQIPKFDIQVAAKWYPI